MIAAIWFPKVLLYSLLFVAKIQTIQAKRLNVVRNGNVFGIVNFDRIAKHALFNATFATIADINYIECISKCKKNKACRSLNYRKKPDGATLCELNDHNRISVGSELSFQPQGESEYFEVQTPCSKAVCYNGGVCQFNDNDNTHHCRCPMEFSGPKCRQKNDYVGKFLVTPGIVNGELFLLGSGLNYTMATTVCKAFGGTIPTTSVISRVARESRSRNCYAAWAYGGRIGYPEYLGNCHANSVYTGYYSSSCCSSKSNLQRTWCWKKNIDYCEIGWFAFGRNCFLIRDDDTVTKEEAIEMCTARGGHLTDKYTTDFTAFIQRVCPSCKDVHLDIKKVDGAYRTLNSNIPGALAWANGQPSDEHPCVGMSMRENGLKTVSCDKRQGYICQKRCF